jgi:hypothetical protein
MTKGNVFLGKSVVEMYRHVSQNCSVTRGDTTRLRHPFFIPLAHGPVRRLRVFRRTAGPCLCHTVQHKQTLTI